MVFAFAVAGASAARAGDDHGGGKDGGAQSAADGASDDGASGDNDSGGDGGGGGGDGGGGGGSDDGGASFSDEDDDHDLARDLVGSGKIRPLNDIVRSLAARVPGRVVGVRLTRAGGRWVYAFRLVTPEGTRMKVEVDAATMAIRGTGR